MSAEEEIIGLDKLEHGLDTSYAGFAISYSEEEIEEAREAGIGAEVISKLEGSAAHTSTSEPAPAITKVPEAPLTKAAVPPSAPLRTVVIVTRQNKFDALKKAMNRIGVTGMTVSNVMGCGAQKGASEYYRGTPVDIKLLPKLKIEITVSKVPVATVVEAAKKALYTGHIGDGKIFVYDAANAVRVRTGEEGYDALQDD